MHIVYDGMIFEMKSLGGIARIYEEIIPRIGDLASDARIDMVYAKRASHPSPTCPNLREQRILSLESYLRPRQLLGGLRNAARELMLSTIPHSSSSVWHSTYYTQPKFWRGQRVLTVYDMIHELLPEYFTAKQHEKFRQRKRCQIADADIVTCISDATQRDVHRLYGTSLEKLRRVYPAYRADVFYREIQESDQGQISVQATLPKRPFILYVGLRSAYKNFSTLLAAYSTWRYCNDVDLVIVGRAWDNDERGDLQSRNLESQVHAFSNVDDHHLRALYNRALAFVYPSHYEGFGIPLLEAMACGCPIVASRIPTTLEVAQDYPLYFSPSNEDELQAALTEALEKGRHDALTQTSASILPAFSWEKTAQGYLDVYRELL